MVTIFRHITKVSELMTGAGTEVIKNVNKWEKACIVFSLGIEDKMKNARKAGRMRSFRLSS